MKMVILPLGGQRAVRGQVINFPANVDCIISELPRFPSGEDILYIQQPDSIENRPNDSVLDTIYHTCRYSNVMQALKWLKQHNPLYGDITITKMSEDMFNHKEEKVTDGENVNEDILEMDETGIVRLDALQPIVEDVDLIQGSIPIEQQIHKLQRVTTIPLSIFENQNDLEVLAFPTLYPNGDNGFGTIREVKVTPLGYFQTRMLSDDSRWACHPAYII